jgi:hypothetical protein
MYPDAGSTEYERHAAEEVCRSIYEETARLYKASAPNVAGQDLGYRILYGPPVVRPEYMFIGFQPGGQGDSVRVEQLRSWPPECEYALDRPSLKAAGWAQPKLALNMQKVWGVPILKRSTGLNAIFFRSPKMEDWARIEKGLRTELEEFSRGRVRRIVGALRPKRLAVIGLGTFDWLTDRQGASVATCNGRALVKRGKLWGALAFGVMHLSGARLSGTDLDVMKAYFAEQDSN